MRYLASLSASVLCIILSFSVQGVHADNLPAPSGKVLLTITGNMTLPNVGNEVHLDIATLESLPTTEFVTSSPWHESAERYTGVRLNDLLSAIGSSSREIVAIGLDDYRFTITDLDLEHYPVMIAYRQNDSYISVRSLGPLRIMMPFDEYPELLTPLNESRSVWQLVKMELH
ncbi:molybdopterin-dependent oxidoreductase [Granulosicoccus sp. 3-233]|uniref:molybdopterin-dependent oxidoreductase n=1 Tax=Granulosicoccus sp. 3-233 TaxID=3417969 RepID=UPI003D340F2F